MIVKNLAFKGAGVCGQAYTGAYLELEKRGITRNLEKVAGTSAGSIVAGLIALGYSSKEMYDISANTDFRTFADGNFFTKLRARKYYGIHPGNAFLKWIREKITEKGFKPDATFKDFRDAGCLDLHVFATNLNTLSLRQFCYEKTPNVPVAEAIRASMSIPGFFYAYKFTNGNPDNYIYVDGGSLLNYPLSAFDNGYENKETLGLFIGNLTGAEIDSGLSFGQPVKFVKANIETLLYAQSLNVINDKEDMERTIVINNCGVGATNFDLTWQDKANLFEAGRQGVISFYSKYLWH